MQHALIAVSVRFAKISQTWIVGHYLSSTHLELHGNVSAMYNVFSQFLLAMYM